MAELSSVRNHHQHIWPCECGDSHFLEITWDDEEPDWRYLNIIEAYWPTSWKYRLKGAWAALRGKRHDISDLMLTEKTVAEVMTVLSKHAHPFTVDERVSLAFNKFSNELNEIKVLARLASPEGTQERQAQLQELSDRLSAFLEQQDPEKPV